MDTTGQSAPCKEWSIERSITNYTWVYTFAMAGHLLATRVLIKNLDATNNKMRQEILPKGFISSIQFILSYNSTFYSEHTWLHGTNKFHSLVLSSSMVSILSHSYRPKLSFDATSRHEEFLLPWHWACNRALSFKHIAPIEQCFDTMYMRS